jgi:hypothetical protein
MRRQQRRILPGAAAMAAMIVLCCNLSYAEETPGPVGKTTDPLERYHEIKSEYQDGPQELAIFLPRTFDPQRKYRVLYIVAVDAGRLLRDAYGGRFGNDYREIRELDIASRFNVIVARASFSDTPWFTDPRHGEYYRNSVVPFVEEHYPTIGGPEGRCLVGFSKTGYGVLKLMVTYPDYFGYAASWDANADPRIIQNIMKTNPASLDPLRTKKRIVLGIGDLFWEANVAYHRELVKAGIPHHYDPTQYVGHGWRKTWMVPAITALLRLPEDSDLAMPAAVEPLAASDPRAGIVGWRMDGSGDFRDAHPPATFDGSTGMNLLWKTRMDRWSDSSPIVVKPRSGSGPDRVFCMQEPFDGYAPTLRCLHADTGEELWRRALDPVPLMPAEIQDEARTLATQTWQTLEARRCVDAEICALLAEHRDAFLDDSGKLPDGSRELPSNLQPAFAPLLQRARDAGMELRNPQVYRGRILAAWTAGLYPDRETGPKLAKWQLRVDPAVNPVSSTFRIAYPTPVSDGQRVYTITGHNLYSCYDLDGTLIWQRRFAAPDEAALDETARARVAKVWPPQNSQNSLFNTSPVLWHDDAGMFLVSMAGLYVRVLRAESGEVVWEKPLRGTLPQMAVPTVLSIDGLSCVILVDQSAGKGMEILRLSDGAVIGELPGVPVANGGGALVLLDNGRVVLRALTDSPYRAYYACYSMSLNDAGQVVLKEHWQTGTPEPWQKGGVGFRYFDLANASWRGSAVYGGAAILDSELAGIEESHAATAVGTINTLTRNHRVQFSDRTGEFLFWGLDNSLLHGMGKVPVQPEEDLAEAQRRGIVRTTLGGAAPFAYKDRLYVRSYDYLWCFAPTAHGMSASDPSVLAKIKQSKLPADVSRFLEHTNAQYRYEAVKRIRAFEQLDGAIVERLKTVASGDSNSDVRAEAFRTLGLEPGQAGAVLLHDALSKRIDYMFKFAAPDPLLDTLHCLGSDLAALLVDMMRGEDSKDHLRAVVVMVYVRPAAVAALKIINN